jgi:regulatory protein
LRPYLLHVVNSIPVALAYLARFARTELQLRQYLRRKGFSQNEISDAVAYLVERKFLNDDSYARAYIESRIRRMDGPFKIKQLLLQKGISSATAQELLRELYPDELQIENAIKLAGAKKSKSREQQLRFIASRGYSRYVIMQALNATTDKHR